MNATLTPKQTKSKKTSLDQRKVLVLNACWTPINTIPLKEAIKLTYGAHEDTGKPKAHIIEPESYMAMSWNDWSQIKPEDHEDDTIQGVDIEVRVPEIIVLSKYDKMPKPRVNFSRRTLFKRDKYTCQYCGKKPRNDELTVDHVVPRAQGGLTTWENTVLACYKCNTKKANRTPKQANLKLLNEPKRPDVRHFKCDITHKVNSWQAFLGECYWNVTLENDMEDYQE